MLNRPRVAAFVNFANQVRYVRQLLEQTLQTFQQWLYEQPFHLVQTSGGMTNKMKRLLHGASRSLGQTNRANYHEWRARLNDTPWKLQVPRPHLRFGNLAGLPSVYGFDRWKAHTREDESFDLTRRQGITVITQRMTGPIYFPEDYGT